MIFRQLFDEQSHAYTYLLGSNGEALLIDPVIGKIDQYIQLLKELNLKLVKVIDTHVHADHVTALGKLRDLTGCISLMSKESQVSCASENFQDGDIIKVGDIALLAIHTPGHTDDSYSFYIASEDGGLLFTGDTLLIRGSGRTDFQNGSARDQYDSLFNKLLSLPENTLVYPGHDYRGYTVSTLGEEKLHNPRLQVENQESYVALMDNLNLSTPALMHIAIPINKSCGQKSTAQ